jgi:hypothetical protein
MKSKTIQVSQLNFFLIEKVLKNHLIKFEKNLDLVIFPSAFLNGHRIRGTLDLPTYSSAICEDYVDLPRPCLDYINRISPHSHFLVYNPELWGILSLFLVIICLAIFVLYKLIIEKKIHKSIKTNINQHITQYSRIENNRHQYSNVFGKDTELTPTESF